MSFSLGTLTHERKLEILKAVKEFKLDNEIFIQGGTMLGCVREQGLIDNDDDIDIAYISKYHTSTEIKKEMLDIYRDLIDKKMMCEYFDLDYKVVIDFDNLVEGRGQAHIMVGGLCIDLWTTWVDEEGYINFCDIPKICKAEDFLPLRVEKIYDIEFKIPKNAEQLLEKIYGKDWTTPQHTKPRLDRKTVLQR